MTDSYSSETPAYFPPPWNLTAEMYTFLVSSSTGSTSLPPSAYNRLEAQSDFADETKSGKFKGGALGLGLVCIIRYHTSPVGPYDELAYLPGKFETPGGNNHLRCTNIYVSSAASIYNGRRIWNIPKHLATFSFTELPEQENNDSERPGSKRVHIQVSQPHMNGSEANVPFFNAICTLNPHTFIPESFPFNTDDIPFMNAIQTSPPLPGLPNSAIEISTNEWRTFKSSIKGIASLMSIQPADESDGEIADGVHFPKIKFFVGVYAQDVDMIVSEPMDEA